MKIKAENYNGKDVRVSIETETCAEAYQLDAFRKELTDAGADWYEWDDMNGRSGIGMVVLMKPNVELTGCRLRQSSDRRERG